MKTIVKQFIVISIQLLVIKSEDFQKSFAENNYNIDYGYQCYEKHYVFIGLNYWELSSDSTCLMSNESKIFDGFGNEKRMPFQTMTVTPDKTVITGLIEKTDYSFEWKAIKINENTGALEVDKTFNRDNTKANDTSFDADFTPSLAFSSEYHDICFLQQVFNKTTNLWTRGYRCLRFNRNLEPYNYTDAIINEVMDEETVDNSTVLNGIEGTREVVAIYRVIVNKVKRYVFYYRNNQIIEYCLTNDIKFQKECTETKELALCSELPGDPNTSEKPSDGSLNYLWILIIIAVVLTLIVIVVIVYLKSSDNEKKEPMTATESTKTATEGPKTGKSTTEASVSDSDKVFVRTRSKPV